MMVLIHSRGSNQHPHATYYQLGGRARWYTDRQSTKVPSCYLISLVFGISLLPLSKDEYPPVFLTMMFMLLYAFINENYVGSATYSSNRMNANLLSLLLNVVTRNLRI